MPDKCLAAVPYVMAVKARSRPFIIYGHAYRMQVVERRLEQAAEDPRSRPAKVRSHPAVIPAKAGIQWFRLYIPA